MSKRIEADLNNCNIATSIYLTTAIKFSKAHHESYSVITGVCHKGAKHISCSCCIFYSVDCRKLTKTLPIIAQHFPHLRQLYPELFI